METVGFGLCRVQEVPLKLEEYRNERPTLHLSGPFSNSALVFMSFIFFEQFFCWLIANSLLTRIVVLAGANLIRTGLNKTMMVGWISSPGCQKTVSSRGNNDEEMIKC